MEQPEDNYTSAVPFPDFRGTDFDDFRPGEGIAPARVVFRRLGSALLAATRTSEADKKLGHWWTANARKAGALVVGAARKAWAAATPVLENAAATVGNTMEAGRQRLAQSVGGLAVGLAEAYKNHREELAYQGTLDFLNGNTVVEAPSYPVSSTVYASRAAYRHNTVTDPTQIIPAVPAAPTAAPRTQRVTLWGGPAIAVPVVGVPA